MCTVFFKVILFLKIIKNTKKINLNFFKKLFFKKNIMKLQSQTLPNTTVYFCGLRIFLKK